MENSFTGQPLDTLRSPDSAVGYGNRTRVAQSFSRAHCESPDGCEPAPFWFGAASGPQKAGGHVPSELEQGQWRLDSELPACKASHSGQPKRRLDKRASGSGKRDDAADPAFGVVRASRNGRCS